MKLYVVTAKAVGPTLYEGGIICKVQSKNLNCSKKAIIIYVFIFILSITCISME